MFPGAIRQDFCAFAVRLNRPADGHPCIKSCPGFYTILLYNLKIQKNLIKIQELFADMSLPLAAIHFIGIKASYFWQKLMLFVCRRDILRIFEECKYRRRWLEKSKSKSISLTSL